VIPDWMLDEARCRWMRLCPEPEVCWQALSDLRGLLDDLSDAAESTGHGEEKP